MADTRSSASYHVCYPALTNGHCWCGKMPSEPATPPIETDLEIALRVLNDHDMLEEADKLRERAR